MDHYSLTDLISLLKSYSSLSQFFDFITKIAAWNAKKCDAVIVLWRVGNNEHPGDRE